MHLKITQNSNTVQRNR